MTPAETSRVLVIDDNDDARYALERSLQHNGYAVKSLNSGVGAPEAALEFRPAVLLLDIMMPTVDGYEVARKFKSHEELRFVPILFVTAKSALEDVIRGLDAGADDYIVKPFKTEELLARLRVAERTRSLYDELRSTKEKHRSLVSELRADYSFGNIVGRSQAMQQVFTLLGKVAGADSPVLITGASGTGKELIARAIHFNSRRREEPFIARNCAAFSETLLESELFGHTRGAFTGASREHRGIFEAADGGTLFLDEVGEMSPALQAKLLRVLQEGTFSPVGATSERKVNVRVLAATNRDLLKMVDAGSFREDLYFRLNVINLQLPSLSERKEDIPLLAAAFMERACSSRGVPVKKFTQAALDALCSYPWRGNVRELQNEIERVVILSGEDAELGPEHLSERISGASPASVSESQSLKASLEAVEKRLIKEALERNHWNKSKAARELEMSRSNLLAKIEAYGLEVKSAGDAQDE